MSKKTWTDRLGDFVAGKGFYIVLFLCVAAIGISGYYLFSTLGPDEEEAAVDAPAQVVVTPAPAVTPTPKVTPTPVKPSVTPTPTPTVEPSPSITPQATPTVSPTPTVVPSAAPKPSASKPAASVYTWPVKGAVIRDFSLEVLAYDETMGDWRTHSGLDIAASVGTEVCAVSDGTVEVVYADDLMGTTVVIDHGNGVKSIYSNLAAVPTVKKGDAVSTGTVIGAVGETALAEIGREPHLHLEMSANGMEVDPTRYLPE